MTLKKLSVIALSAFLGMNLFAITRTSASDGFCKVEFDKGKIKVYVQNGKISAMTVIPNPAMAGVSAKSINDRRGSTLLLRGDKSSLAFILRNGTLQISGASGIRELNISMDAKAIILPDIQGEDLIVRPQKDTVRRIPAFLPYFTVLAGKENLVISCVRAAAVKDTSFRDKTFTFPQGNGEDLIFTFISGKNVWKEMNNITKGSQAINWVQPFPAYWTASFETKKGYVGWPCFDLKDKDYSIKVERMAKTCRIPENNPPTMWSSGLGWINYPFYIDDGAVKLRIPSKGVIKEGEYSGDHVLIYPKNRIQQTPKDCIFPQQYLAPFTQKSLGSSITYCFPATCGTTEMIEKFFSQEKVKENAKKMHDELDHMDIFQAFIRGRIEQYMRWQEKAAILLANHPVFSSLQPQFNEMKQIYEKQLKNMLYPCDIFKESAQMHAQIESKEDFETREQVVKTLGRKIRSKGGSQDTTCGYFRLILKPMRQNMVLYYMNAKPDLKQDFLLESVYKDSSELMNTWIWTEGK